MQIYVDGEWCTKETAKVSVFDHGLLYGDGVFEGIRAYRRRIFRLQAALPEAVAGRVAMGAEKAGARQDVRAAGFGIAQGEDDETGVVHLHVEVEKAFLEAGLERRGPVGAVVEADAGGVGQGVLTAEIVVEPEA